MNFYQIRHSPPHINVNLFGKVSVDRKWSLWSVLKHACRKYMYIHVMCRHVQLMCRYVHRVMFCCWNLLLWLTSCITGVFVLATEPSNGLRSVLQNALMQRMWKWILREHTSTLTMANPARSFRKNLVTVSYIVRDWHAWSHIPVKTAIDDSWSSSISSNACRGAPLLYTCSIHM